MSRPIKMTEQYLKECREDFEKALKLTKMADGKLSFTKMFSCGEQKATVFFTPEAWAKMVMLVKEFDKEVAWHGVAQRTENEAANEYVISDILVYPQTVSGASVEMDTEEYAKWIMANAEDERFNNIHMQGHSHVNMAPNPSSVDLNHQEEILNMLGDEDFYIFMIWNKSFVSNNKVYDMKKNVLFENTDVTVKIIGGSEDLDEFLKVAKDMVKAKTYQYGSGYNGYGGYGSGSYGVKQSGRTTGGPYNPLPSSSSTKDDKKDDKKTDKKETKSKKDDKKKTRSKIGAGWSGAESYHQRTMFENDDDGYDDDDDWPYGRNGSYGGYGGYGGYYGR